MNLPTRHELDTALTEELKKHDHAKVRQWAYAKFKKDRFSLLSNEQLQDLLNYLKKETT